MSEYYAADKALQEALYLRVMFEENGLKVDVLSSLEKTIRHVLYSLKILVNTSVQNTLTRDILLFMIK